MSETCPHGTVITALNDDQQYEWWCITCKLKFIPITALTEMAEDFDSKMAMALEISAQTAAYILKSVMGPVRPAEGADTAVAKLAEAELAESNDLRAQAHGPFFFGQDVPS